MAVTEINFDGIIGPSHNYAGLSPGNLASAGNSGTPSFPRQAALEGIAKMRANIALGLRQGILLPHRRPDHRWLTALGTDVTNAPPHLRAAAFSASAMWVANAATVSPATDTADHKCHMTAANLVTMPHRSHEWPETLRQLRVAFSSEKFVIHEPVPPPFGDEGAANHMRLCEDHASPGVEVFVYGRSGGPFPVRQHLEASLAVSRLHRLDQRRTLFVEQSSQAIAAGAFHNDVVAVANERILFAHEQAFADKERFFADLRLLLPSVEIIEVPAEAVSLQEAIKTYLFNAQLVTLPAGAGMALIVPTETEATASVREWLQGLISGNGPIRRIIPVDVRQSMANGGGPACLRLRVVADPLDIDPRFNMDDDKLDAIAAIVADNWPEEIIPGDLSAPSLMRQVEHSWLTLVDHLQLSRELCDVP